jgi:hypothetical protein
LGGFWVPFGGCFAAAIHVKRGVDVASIAVGKFVIRALFKRGVFYHEDANSESRYG